MKVKKPQFQQNFILLAVFYSTFAKNNFGFKVYGLTSNFEP
jgi:hypothetical protein